MTTIRTLLAAPVILWGIAGAAHAATIYIPQGDAGEIVMIDATGDMPVGRITGIDNAHGLAVIPGGRFLVAGSLSAAPPKKTPGQASMPPKPAGMSEATHRAHHMKPGTAKTGDNAAEQAVSFISIIDALDRKVVRRVAVPGAVHHVAVTPDGRFAIATHPNTDSVSIVDLSTYTVVKTLRTGSLPNYAVVGADGKRVYVSNAADGAIAEIDTADWTLRRRIAAGESPEHMALSRDGRTLYVANVAAGAVSEIDLASGAIQRSFAIGGTLHGIDLSGDQKTVLVSATEQGRIAAIDRTTGTVTSRAIGPSPYHLATIRGTGKAYVSSADAPKIWVIDTASLRVEREIPIRGVGHQMAVSPSG